VKEKFSLTQEKHSLLHQARYQSMLVTYQRIGTGFLPKETAEHHRKHVLEIVKQALKEANLTMKDIGQKFL
jgi:tRNA A37 threonylcarbamoyltransferase TsaD